MNIRNVIFDVGGVLLQWDPPSFIAKLYPDAAGVHLYLLSNMPVSTYQFLTRQHGFFGHFEHRVISGAIRMVQPEPAIYKHLIGKTAIVPAESVFIDDLTKNVIAARECGLHAIQFHGPDDCRVALRPYLPHVHL